MNPSHQPDAEWQDSHVVTTMGSIGGLDASVLVKTGALPVYDSLTRLRLLQQMDID